MPSRRDGIFLLFSQKLGCVFRSFVRPVLLGSFVVVLLDVVFHLSHSVLYLAFSLLGRALYLGFLISRPLAGLALYTSGDVFGFAFDTVFIHDENPPGLLKRLLWFNARAHRREYVFQRGKN
jgi:hypothetical protein